MTNTFTQFCQPNIRPHSAWAGRSYGTGGYADHEGASEWTENFIDPKRGTRFVGPVVVLPEPPEGPPPTPPTLREKIEATPLLPEQPVMVAPAVAEIEPWVDPPYEIELTPQRPVIDERALEDFNTLARGARL